MSNSKVIEVLQLLPGEVFKEGASACLETYMGGSGLVLFYKVHLPYRK